MIIRFIYEIIVIINKVEMEEAMGLKNEFQDKGFVLLCQSYPKSDLYLIANQEEMVSS